jgi:hypothetical protein
MNHYNKAFEIHVKKVSEALEKLMHFGCAIKGLSITDKGDFIDILPPLTPNIGKHLNGYEVAINGDSQGRHYEFQARICGCTVRWQSNQNTQPTITR